MIPSGPPITNLDLGNQTSLGWTGPATARLEVRDANVEQARFGFDADSYLGVQAANTYIDLNAGSGITGAGGEPAQVFGNFSLELDNVANPGQVALGVVGHSAQTANILDVYQFANPNPMLGIAATGAATLRTNTVGAVNLTFQQIGSQTGDPIRHLSSGAVLLNRLDTSGRMGFRETTTPVHVSHEGELYTKEFGGRTERGYFDSDGAATGVEVRLTTLGAVRGIGPGTTNRLAKFTGAAAIGDSSITDTSSPISSAAPAPGGGLPTIHSP